MVRPGFYLGRAYVDRVFLLDFILYNEDIAERDGPSFAKTGQAAEDFWPAPPPRVAAVELPPRCKTPRASPGETVVDRMGSEDLLDSALNSLYRFAKMFIIERSD